MSHRCHIALISNDQVHFHSDKWGALGLAQMLSSGPDGFRAWFERELEVWPDAVGPTTLGVIPEDFAVVNVDRRQLKVSEWAGFQHLPELMHNQLPELAEHLADMTPDVRRAVLVVLRERWPAWKVSFAADPKPQVDWLHLRDMSTDQVWEAFSVTIPPKAEEQAVDRLAQLLRTLV